MKTNELELGFEAHARINLDNDELRKIIENMDINFLNKTEKAVLSELQIRRQDKITRIGLVYHIYSDIDENSLRYLRRYKRILTINNNEVDIKELN